MWCKCRWWCWVKWLASPTCRIVQELEDRRVSSAISPAPNVKMFPLTKLPLSEKHKDPFWMLPPRACHPPWRRPQSGSSCGAVSREATCPRFRWCTWYMCRRRSDTRFSRSRHSGHVVRPSCSLRWWMSDSPLRKETPHWPHCHWGCSPTAGGAGRHSHSLSYRLRHRYPEWWRENRQQGTEITSFCITRYQC